MATQPPSNAPTTKTDPLNIKSLEELCAMADCPNEHAAADAVRVMTRTNSWTPALNRRQSWNNQERKHELQMHAVVDAPTGPGFSERK